MAAGMPTKESAIANKACINEGTIAQMMSKSKGYREPVKYTVTTIPAEDNTKCHQYMSPMTTITMLPTYDTNNAPTHVKTMPKINAGDNNSICPPCQP